MLEVGFRGGTILDFRQLNLIAKTAEQMANVNICSHIKGLSDNGKVILTNTIYQTQLKDRLMLVAVYASSSTLSLPSYQYPILTAVTDHNSNNLLAQFTFISNVSEEFDKVIDGVTYKITLAKTSYAVLAGGINKRLKIDFSPRGASEKDFDASFFNSMFVMQVDSVLTQISQLSDQELSDYAWFNKVKQAFRLNQSYNLAIYNLAGDRINASNIFNFINYYNDLYEVGALSGVSPYVGVYLYDFFLTGVITTGTLFDYKVFTQTLLNFNKAGRYSAVAINGGLYLTTTDTFNFAIDSITLDALNSYDLIMIKRDYANRLQGKLYYPVIGESLITTGNPVTPVNVNITMYNNINAEDYAYELELVNGYKLKFAIR